MGIFSRWFRRRGHSQQPRVRHATAPDVRTPGGSVVYRYAKRTGPEELAFQTADVLKAVQDHVERHIGPVKTVFHELVSDLVHIDVLMVAPRPERDYWTFVTCGMSGRPMSTPAGLEQFAFAELLLCLPSDWRVGQQDPSD